MKILHIAPHIDEGGVQTLLYEMSRYQTFHGNEVSILSLLNNTKYYDKEDKYLANNVKIIHGKYDNVYDPRHILVIKNELAKYDIVHIHNFPNQLFAKIAYSLLPKKKRPKLITTEHNTYNNRRQYKILKYLDRWFYKSYDCIVAISYETEKRLKEWLQSPTINRKITTIVNGINLKKFQNAKSTVNNFLPPKQDRKLVVMVSRMEHPKDPITLVKSLVDCPSNVEIVLVGSGPLLKEVSILANTLNLSDRVHLLGNQWDVAGILKGCDIGVLSTQWDGFGLVSVEYMASGLPVLVTNVDGLREVVGDKDALFEYQNAKELANKINKLLENQDYYQKKKEYSLNRCEAFSIDKMNDHYLNLYHYFEQHK